MYEKVSNKEIGEVAEHDPIRALLMVMVNDVSVQATNKMASLHQPSFHQSGWSITIETDKGLVGLWSCWLEDKFYIGYPLDYKDDMSSLIKDILKVNDSPMEVPHYIDNTMILRQWAKFHSERYDGYGRVWIDYAPFNSYSHEFLYIKENNLTKVYYGHHESYSICTFPFTFYSEKAPDSPTTRSEIIQQYRNGFIELAITIALKIGKIQAININYGFVIVPEQLESLGYTNIKYIKGNKEKQDGWGNTVIYACKGSEEIILKSGNSLVPWSTIRRIPTDRLDGKDINNYLIF